MRILQVSSAEHWGGGETHVAQLVESLQKLGHEVVVAGRLHSPLKPHIELPFLNSADFITAIRLRARLMRKPFDIVHAHVARDYTIVAASAWKFPQPKLVFTRHLLHRIQRHFFYRRVDAWIAPTSEILKTLAPLAPKVSQVIPNWVDLERFPFRPHPLHKPVTIGLLGEISPHKGHDDAIEALRLLGGNFRLLIAGKGDASYEKRLQERAAGLPVDFLGLVAPADFFQTIDILILPSWEEPFGIVLLEAAASGIPVVATNRGGPVEIISSPSEGVLVPPRDPSGLANAIRTLAADGERRSTIIHNARQRVEKHFDIRIVVTQIEEFYRRIISSRERP